MCKIPVKNLCGGFPAQGGGGMSELCRLCLSPSPSWEEGSVYMAGCLASRMTVACSCPCYPHCCHLWERKTLLDMQGKCMELCLVLLVDAGWHVCSPAEPGH